MDFLKINKPDINIINKCIKLAKEINVQDNLEQPIFSLEEFNSIKNLPVLYYALENNQIIGFIGISYVMNAEIEICCFISPNYRNNKIASRLLEMVFDDYPDFTITVSLVPSNKNGKYLLDSYDAKYCASECIMELNKLDYKWDQEVTDLKKSVIDDVLLYELEIDSQTIGCAKVFDNNNSFTIFAVEINETYQGKGYGKLLMNSLLSLLFKNKDNAILHVTKENVAAYNLYLNLGFKISTELEYYTL